MLEFHNNFLKVITTREDIHLGMKSEIESLSKKNFTLWSISSFYIMLGGKDISQFDNLSLIEQSKVYSVVSLIFASQGKSTDDLGELHGKYIKKMEETTAKIPSQVREFSKELLTEFTAAAIEGAVSAMGYIK